MRFLIIFFATFLFGDVIFYCGITMRKPMNEIAKIIEQKYNTKIQIIPGGSKSLLETIENTQKGDLYLPGSENYILKNKSLFSKYKQIGINELALIVKKNNPKNIKNLNDLLRNDINVVLCNYKFSSCGKETKKLFTQLKGKNFYWKVFDKSIEIVLDSKPLNEMVKNYADVGPNWKASIINEPKLKAIPIKNSHKHKLYLAILNFSKNKDIAQKFLDFATSKEGQKIMKRYGFR